MSLSYILNVPSTLLQHQAWRIIGKPGTYQQEMICIINSLQSNSYPASITSASISSYRRVKDNNQKSFIACLPYIKSTSEKIQSICGSQNIQTVVKAVQLFGNISPEPSYPQKKTLPKIVCIPSCAAVSRNTKKRLTILY